MARVQAVLVRDGRVLSGVLWLRLDEIPGRDRAYLWAAGLLGADCFASEVERWGSRISYPGEQDAEQSMQAAGK